jgi:hypothetical protein
MYKTRHNRSYGALDYLMPFLIILAVGVIVVMLFNLWKAFFSEDVEKAAYLHVVEGSAEMKTWGTDDFFSLSSDALIMQGDEIVASADAKLIVELFDGTIMRMDGGSDVIFEDIDEEENFVSLILVDGNVWFNKVYKGVEDSQTIIRTSNLELKSESSSIFEVENGEDEVVRVFKGNGEDLMVDVYDNKGEKVVAEENLGVGQQIVFSEAVLQKYWKFQSPTVLSAISDDFKEGDWYAWNGLEDQVPTAFDNSIGGGLVKVEPELVEEEGAIVPDEPTGEEVVADETVDELADEPAEVPVEEPAEVPAEPVISADLEVPTIISVSGGTQTNENGFYVVQNNPAVLKGGATGASKIVVNNYTLSKFMPGESVWTYYANIDYDFMKVGENTYEAYALDADGNKSESTFIKVLYEPKVEEVVTGVETSGEEEVGE